jgi:pimeloyl-ACP methyl ester carboxylesterase
VLRGPLLVGGLRTYCTVQGTGPAALLLHGWGGTSASLQPLAAHLAQRFRTVTPDLPGFGHTALPPTDWGVADYAAWAEELLAKLGIRRAVLLGHSFGGRIAIVLAATRPALVERLVLIDSAGLRPPPAARRRAIVLVSKAGRAAAALPLFGPLAARLRRRWHRLVGAEDYANAGPLRGTFVRVVNQDLREFLPRVTAPTLLLWGAADTATPASDGALMAQLIPQARLIVFPRAGHFAYLERLAETCAALDEFLAPALVHP